MIDDKLKQILRRIGETDSGKYLIEYLEAKIKRLQLTSSIDKDDFEVSGKVNIKMAELLKEMCALLKREELNKPKEKNQYT